MTKEKFHIYKYQITHLHITTSSKTSSNPGHFLPLLTLIAGGMHVPGAVQRVMIVKVFSFAQVLIKQPRVLLSSLLLFKVCYQKQSHILPHYTTSTRAYKNIVLQVTGRLSHISLRTLQLWHFEVTRVFEGSSYITVLICSKPRVSEHVHIC